MKVLPARPALKTGKYWHFKGGVYLVTASIFNATTDRWMVQYFDPLTKNWFVRDLEDFMTVFAVEDGEVERFKWVGPLD